MTNSELMEILAQYPDNATIYVESDHGQVPEQVEFVAVSKDEELPYYGEDVSWKDCQEVRKHNQVTAIKIY